MTDDTANVPEWLVRRGQIIRLLEVLNEGLPEPSRRDQSTSGFVNEARSRSCPDCLANGRVMFGCETCGGSGEVTASRVAAIAVPDGLPDDGSRRDPYAVNDRTTAFAATVKLGHVPTRDADIDRAKRLARERPVSELDAAANAEPYVWERERAALRKRYDVDRLAVALDELRITDEAGYRLLHSVYVYGWADFSVSFEAAVERALRFLSGRLPERLRAPGDALRVESPAVQRLRRRNAA